MLNCLSSENVSFGKDTIHDFTISCFNLSTFVIGNTPKDTVFSFAINVFNSMEDIARWAPLFLLKYLIVLHCFLNCNGIREIALTSRS